MRLRLLAGAVCALGTHALLYGTFSPDDGLHGYLGWYEPAVALVALAALAVVRPAALRSRRPIADTARRVATAALFVVLAQESLERTVQQGQPPVVALRPSEWLVLLAGVALTSLALAVALRARQVALDLLSDRRARRSYAARAWSVVTAHRRSTRPLAERFALRAPPAPAR